MLCDTEICSLYGISRKISIKSAKQEHDPSIFWVRVEVTDGHTDGQSAANDSFLSKKKMR